MSAAPKRIAIVGAGSIGCLLGLHLTRRLAPAAVRTIPSLKPTTTTNSDTDHISRNAKPAITFLTRSPSPPTVTIHISEQQAGSTSAYSAHTALNTASCDAFDAVVVTTKAQDTLDAVRPLVDSGAVTSATALALVQNGYGQHAELVETALRPAGIKMDHLVLGSTTHGCYRDSSADRAQEGPWAAIHHAGVGTWTFGPWTCAGRPRPVLKDGNVPWLLSELGALPTATAVPEDAIQGVLLRKLAVNAVINPLTAVYRVRNGDLVDNPSLAADMAAVTQEIAAILCAQFPTAYLDLHDPAQLLATVTHVCHLTARNWSSMYVDATTLGHTTEISYIAGPLLAWARQHGVPHPRLSALAHAILTAAPPRAAPTRSRATSPASPTRRAPRAAAAAPT
ncbi:2-dehydropantoate 2-reductase (Ketopantoate reductase) (KPA reductase) (KPR) [Allomyces arbusculus]|nr:2-dehydropantoate 2-reductase (Ketopantoate reductase) (KPA reductase) (KPR) [Allomyces arbusculus]